MLKHLPFSLKAGLLISLFSAITISAFAQPQPVIASHPRIFLDATTKSTLIAKKNANDPDWQTLLAQANKYTTGTVIPWNETSAGDAQYYGTNNIFYSYCGSSWEEAAMTLGLAHQLTKTNNAGANTTAYSDKLMQFADVIIQAYHDYPPNSSGGPNIFQFNTAYATRHVGKTIAAIYDYCYDELGATRKAALMNVMKDWFTYMSSAPFRVFQQQDQPTGNYYMGHVVCAGYMGLAIAGDDPLSQKMIDFARQRITGDPGTLNPNTSTSGESSHNYFTQSVKGNLPTAASQSYLGPSTYVGAPQKDGLPVQGWSYGGETMSFLMDYLRAVKSATGEDVVQTDVYLKTYFANASIAMIHSYAPNRFQTDNSNDNGSFIGSVANYALLLHTSAFLEGTTEGANLQYFYKSVVKPVNLLSGNTGYLPLNWEKLLFNKTRTSTAYNYKPYYPTPTTNAYNSIPLNSGLHKYYMRNNWTTSSTWAAINMGAGVFDSHNHNAAGHFKIVRGDTHDGDDQILVGANEVAKAGGNGIDGPTNYSFSNSFGNTLFLNDYNDYDIPYQDYANGVGGQNSVGFDAPTNEEQNDNFSYFRADLTSAYYVSYSNPDTTQRSIRYYYRSFLYLRNSDIFLTYDKVLAKNSTNPAGQYVKHLRWHFLTSPTVNGSNITEVMDNSKLYIHTVIPATTNVAVVDENTNPDNTFGSGYDYAFNTNTWRAEVSVPGNPLKQDIVTVLQPGSKTTSTEMTTVALQTSQNNMEGSIVNVNGNTEVVLFNNSVAKYPTPITLASYAFTGPSNANHTLCGMAPNQNYNIAYNSSVVTVTKTAAGAVTASPSGVLNFKLQSLTLSNNDDLANMVISHGTLAPAFATATTDYATSVTNTTTSIKVTPTAADAGATITVNGMAVTSGTASGAIALQPGQTAINVSVTAQNGANTKIYSITVTRATSTNANISDIALSSGTLSPAFATSTTVYTSSVVNAIHSIKITPTTSDPDATVKVNGVAVAQGTASADIPLIVGTTNITVVTLASDGVTKKTYKISISRPSSNNANLAGLSVNNCVLSPAFVKTTTAYTASVNNTIASTSVIATTSDPDATVTVNGTAVAQGSASPAIPLIVGSNTITVVVTASDGATKKTYHATITRAKSENADLSGLSITHSSLSPAFAAATTGYTAAVINTFNAVTVTPTTSNAAATVTVNGVAITSGTASASLPLTVGDNIVTIKVTAQNGITTKTYTITATRAASSNANLKSLAISDGTLSPVFAAATASYTASVSNATTSVTVTPITNDPDATLTVNGILVKYGATSAGIPLSVGSNLVTIVVTASDGTTKKTYKITFTRASGAIGFAGDNTGLAEDGISVHQGLSPNGDGVNDFLVIDGITACPDNTLSIMDRTGELVFEIKGYDNNTKVFDGHSSKTGKRQQAGTYFYSLEYKVDGAVKHKTGFVIIK